MNPLSKVFQVLEAVTSRQSEGALFTEVLEETGLARATAHRILKNLAELGYLTYSGEDRRYRGSMKLAGMGAEVMANFNLRDHIHPFLLSMNKETDYTCNAGIISDGAGVFIDKVDTQDFGVKLFSEVGKSFPLHCTAMGKILLAHSPEEKIDRVLARRLRAFTEKTLVDPAHLRRELAQVREQGLAIDREEITRGIMCVAAPIKGLDSRVLASISITFPVYAAEDGGLDKLLDILTKHATECSGRASEKPGEHSGARGN